MITFKDFMEALTLQQRRKRGIISKKKAKVTAIKRKRSMRKPPSPEKIDKAPTGKLFIDGKFSVNEDAPSIIERKRLAFNGSLEVTVIFNKYGELLKKPIISIHGIPYYEGEIEELNIDLEDEIINTCKTFSLKTNKQHQILKETIKINCRKVIKNKTGKKPYTHVSLVQI